MKSDRNTRLGTLLPWILILAAGIAAYANGLSGAFQFDDLSSIVNNAQIRALDLGALWRVYGLRTAVYFTFALNYRLGGLEPAGFHLANVAIHLASACTLFALARILLTRAREIGASPLSERASRAAALTAALLFVVHPVQTQAVTYIVQRLASQAALFYLLALLGYAAGRARMLRGAPRAWPCFALALGSAAVAMLSKQNAFTLPAAAVLVELLFFQGLEGKALRRKLPLLAAALVALLVFPAAALIATGASLDDLSELTRETDLLSRREYFLTQLSVLATYLRLLVVPIHQRLDYVVLVSKDFWQLPTMLAALLHAAMIGIAALCWRRSRVACFGILFFYLAHLVESGVIPIRDLLFEHRTYLPAAGIFLAAGALFWQGQERWSLPRRAAWAIVVAAVVALGIATHQRNEVWKTAEGIWGEVLEHDPHSWRANYNLGKELEARGDLAGALERYRASAAIRPTAWSFNNLGNMLMRIGRREEAIAAYRQAIVRNYAFPNAHANLAVALEAKGDLAGAKRENLEALRFDERFAAASYNLGRIAMVEGNLEEARRWFEQTIKADPNHVLSHYRLGLVFAKTGQVAEAARELSRALALDPGNERVRRALEELRP